MGNELEDLEVVEISIVDKPANERDVLLFKSQGDKSMNSDNLEESSFEKTEEFTELIEKKDFGKEQELKLRASLRTLESLQEDLPQDEYQDIARSVFGDLVQTEKDEGEEDGLDASEVADQIVDEIDVEKEKAESVLSSEEIISAISKQVEKELNDDADTEGSDEPQQEEKGIDPEKVEDVLSSIEKLSEDVEDEDSWSSVAEELNDFAKEADLDVSLEAEPQETPDLEDLPEDVQEKVDDIYKSKEEVEKEREKLEKELQEYREELEKKKEKQAIQKEVDRAEERYPLLKGKAEDFGPLMKNLRDVDEDLYEEVDRKLKAANEQVEESGFYDEAGSSEEPDQPDNPIDQLNKIAEDIQENSDEELTDEQAFRKAANQNPDLYNEYRVEKEKRK